MASEAMALTRFVEAAEAFTLWVDDCDSADADLLSLHLLLADLQISLIRLPSGGDDDDEDEEEALEEKDTTKDHAAHNVHWKTLTEKLSVLPVQRYRVVFDSLTDGDDAPPVIGWLADDLADIYLDLRTGLAAVEQGRVEDAIWEWRFGYFSHWGRHLTHAQCAILDHLRNERV